jgi:hypothetical protein
MLEVTNMYGSMDKIIKESKYICPSRGHISLCSLTKTLASKPKT